MVHADVDSSMYHPAYKKTVVVYFRARKWDRIESGDTMGEGHSH